MFSRQRHIKPVGNNSYFYKNKSKCMQKAEENKKEIKAMLMLLQACVAE